MTTFRFLHCGDAHIGSSLVHGTEENGLNSRVVDFAAAWSRLCQIAVDEQVGGVLFGGDAFRDAKPSPEEKEAFAAGLRLLVAAEIPFVAVEGNHDKSKNSLKPSSLRVFDRYMGGDVRIFERPAITTIGPVPIAVFPWVQRSHLVAHDPEFAKLSLDEQNARIVELSLQVLRKLGAEAQEKAGRLGCVLLAHGTIAGSEVGAQGSTQFFREPVLPLSELRGLPFSYQAFAHLHRAQQLNGFAAYSGSIERIDFAEAGESDKGAWIVTLTENDVDTKWVSSQPRDFVDLELCDPADWEREIAAFNGGCKGAVVRVKYTATPEVARTVDHGGIRRALYAAGAAKVHGPFADITHAVTPSEHPVDEQTSPLAGWREWAQLQGIDGDDFARLDARVQEALEVEA